MDDDEILRLYLTGRLDEVQVDQVEHRLMTEDELFELCEAVEADLLAACARGELAVAERERVLSRLASSPRGRARLALAKGLAAIADGRSETQPLAPRPVVVPIEARYASKRRRDVQWAAALAASVLLAFLGAWLIVERMHTRDAVTRMTEKVPVVTTPTSTRPPRIERGQVPPGDQPGEATPGEEPSAPREEPKVPAAPTQLATAVFQLSLAMVRGEGELQQFQLPEGTGRVEFQIDVSRETSASFGAVLSSRGLEVWKEDGLKPDADATLTLAMPADILEQGRYELAVEGFTPEGDQDFREAQEFEILR